MSDFALRAAYAPSTISRAPTFQQMRSSMVSGSRPVVTISLKGEDPADGVALPNAYSTRDTIEGEVTITTPQDVRFDDIYITFEGISKVWTERLSGTAAMGANRMEVTKTFLKMNQPVDETLLPIPRVALKNHPYKLPFKFVVPDRLLDSACNNHEQGEILRQAHLQLPPSLGTGGNVSHDGKLELDDVAPDMTKIKYVVKVRVTRRREVDNKPVLLVEETRKVQVIPAHPEHPPMVFENSSVGDRFVFRKEKEIRKGLFKGKLGRLIIEADSPKPIEVKARTFMTTLASTVVPVFLRFYPNDPADEAPRLSTLTAKLKFRTYFSTRHMNYVPQRKAAAFDGLLGQYVETATLASRQLNGVKWMKASDDSDADSAYGSLRRGSDATSSNESTSDSPYYFTQVLVPISQPKSKALVPSFQSCYISRSYELDISIALDTGSRITSSPFQLKLPLQVTSVGDPDAQAYDHAEPPSFDEFFTPRSIAPPQGIPVTADMGAVEEGSQLPLHMLGNRPTMPPPPGYGLLTGGLGAGGQSAYAPITRTTPVGMVTPGMY